VSGSKNRDLMAQNKIKNWHIQPSTVLCL